ncbi:MAG TPA: glycosyltransferase family A protein [Roseimicrobium sp.]|nr:glycosyltransferase family A protein [Roseimicrobium sp.]
MSGEPTLPRPRVTFGMIVLNGEPFLRYNLRALYPFAHQIIVVEGAAPAAVNIATADGHSRDGTLESLKRFKAEEDPENKLVIVTAGDEGHPDGFWPGEKHEQSQAYAKRAKGDYLWQVDVDEFYKPEDLQRVLNMLSQDPGITAMSFPTISFSHGFDYVLDGWILRRGGSEFHRLFKWAPGNRYTTHRPPTVVDEQGRDMRTLRWVNAAQLEREGIFMYHYFQLFPKQVREKCDYYSHAKWIVLEGHLRWVEKSFHTLEEPYCVHNTYDQPSWLERFKGIHPQAMLQLRDDIASGRIQVELRPTDDLDWLVGSLSYRLGRARLQFLDWWDRSYYPWQRLPEHPAVHLLALLPRAIRKLKQRLFDRTNPTA